MGFKFIGLVAVIVLLFSVMSGCIEEGKEGPSPIEDQTIKETSTQKEGSVLLVERIVPENEEHKTATNEYISSFENALEDDAWAKELFDEIKSEVSKFKSEDIKKTPEVQKEVARIVFDVLSREIESEEGVFNLSDVLRTKKADCVGYSQVYWIICKKLGLDVGVVDVYKNYHGEYVDENKGGHVCNVLILSDGTEILVDLGYDKFDIKHKTVGDKIVSKEGIYSIMLVKVGSLLSILNKYSEAEKEYRAAISAYPDYAYAHYNLGVVLKMLNRYEEAEKEYTEAIRIEPNIASAHNNLGFLLANSNKFSEAEKEYREAIRINPDLAEAHNNIGILLYKLKKYSEAEEEYRKAIKIDPNDAEAHYNFGNLLLNLNKFSEAEEEYSEVIRIGYGDKNKLADAHNNLGISLYKLNKFSEAEKEYIEAIKLNPDYPEAHNNLGALLYDLNRVEEAKNELRTAASLYREQGDYESATEIEETLRNL